MHRTSFLIVVSLVFMIGMLAIGRSPGIGAHEGTPEAMSGHPFVGRWLVDTDVNNPDDAPELASVTADGMYLALNFDVGPGLGSWEAGGEGTVNATIWFTQRAANGSFGGLIVARAQAEIAANGQSWTATYTIEIVAPDGTVSGQFGPGMASATRLSVEPMGEPIGTFDDLFAPPATPEA